MRTEPTNLTLGGGVFMLFSSSVEHRLFSSAQFYLTFSVSTINGMQRVRARGAFHFRFRNFNTISSLN